MKPLSLEQRALLVHENLFRMLNNPKYPDDIHEFTKGGITACCAILDVESPLTGSKYTKDLRYWADEKKQQSGKKKM